jgi:dTDP-4-dehydrorhamnose reductase
MRIAVVGSRGQLGAAIVHACEGRHEVAGLDRTMADVTDADALRSALARLNPDVIVYCAAYNAVDEAETHAVEALGVNSLAVRTLARAARDRTLVHFGSDFVFDGTGTRPYVETDRPNPLSVYAMSKMLGEWFAADAGRAYVLRVESLFGRAPDGPPARGSVAGLVGAMKAGRRPRVFADRTVTPTHVGDAAAATLALVERGAETGLYHCVNSGSCTWLELATEAARLLGLSPDFEVVSFADVQLPARRPQYCALSNAKLLAAGVAMPTWQDALARTLADEV